MDLFDWCARRGIQLDQSKGASKTGEAGFNFGTCHPYFPVRFNGQHVDVLEMTTPTQDLNVFAPQALLDALLPAVLRHHGILHLLFHPAHTSRPDVAPAFLNSIQQARRAGLEWWTGRAINQWERARRQVKWETVAATHARLRAPVGLPDATLLWLLPGRPGSVHRWGFGFHPQVMSLQSAEAISVSPPDAAMKDAR